MPYKFYPPDTLPAAYDIVWGNFPYVEALGEPAEDEHPILIKAPFFGPDGPEVDAVYGTSSEAANGPRFFPVPPEHQRQCGFNRQTKFDVTRVMRLPWCEEYFSPKGKASPPTRKLPPDAITEFQTFVAYFQNSVK